VREKEINLSNKKLENTTQSTETNIKDISYYCYMRVCVMRSHLRTRCHISQQHYSSDKVRVHAHIAKNLTVARRGSLKRHDAGFN
jgi:hypothetical protein